MQRLATSYGLKVSTLSWLRSYLTHMTQSVCYDSLMSATSLVLIGVPQGSVLGSLIFILYVVDVGEIIAL